MCSVHRTLASCATNRRMAIAPNALADLCTFQTYIIWKTIELLYGFVCLPYVNLLYIPYYVPLHINLPRVYMSFFSGFMH